MLTPEIRQKISKEYVKVAKSSERIDVDFFKTIQDCVLGMFDDFSYNDYQWVSAKDDPESQDIIFKTHKNAEEEKEEVWSS